MLARKHLLLDAIGRAEDAVDLTHAVETLDARGDRKNVVLLPRFHEERPWRDQPGDVVHLGPVQNPRHVVVDAVRQASDAVPERVQVAAYHRDANARLERRREGRDGAAARDAHAADATRI